MANEGNDRKLPPWKAPEKGKTTKKKFRKALAFVNLVVEDFFGPPGTLAEWRCVPLQSLCVFGVTHAGTSVWWAYVLLQALDPEKTAICA